MKSIIILAPDGHVIVAPIRNGITLKMLQDLVGGYIETVPAQPPGTVLIVNEEGKLRGMAYNARATNISRLYGDNIVGIAVMCRAEGEELLPFDQKEAFALLHEHYDLKPNEVVVMK